MKTFDAIVIGLGAMGAATLHHLSLRGAKVLGLERFQPGHDRGSSHGRTRIIRKAYFEHPDYVPLLHQAYRLWADLESAQNQRLFERCGLILGGRSGSEVIAGVRLAAQMHDLDIRELKPADVAAHAKRFRFDADQVVLFEQDAGFLHVEACLYAFCNESRSHGAVIAGGQTVLGWNTDAHGVTVQTADETYAAERLLLCAGPWTASLLRSLHLPLVVRRVPVFWMEPANENHRLDRGCPVFGFDTPAGFFYGFPTFDEDGLKVAQHEGREVIPDPMSVQRDQLPGDFPPIRAFLRSHLPDVGERIQRFTICLYTMTPDQHFIIDRHPDHAKVFFAGGFSGHGFKFAPVVGSALADLAMSGRTNEPIGFLSLNRPVLNPAQ